MLTHDIFHMLNALPILLTLAMAIKLLEQLLSVILIDWLQLFHFSFADFTAADISWDDVVGITEPDWFVIIFKKLTSHLQYFDWIYLWDKVAHLVALL
jgi:hypothetical protein